MKGMPKHLTHPDHPEHHLHKDVRHGHLNEEERGAHHDARERYGRGAMRDGARGAPHEDRAGGNYGRSYGRHGGGDYSGGRDAASIEPRLIPDYELLGRDDSGGPEYQPYTQEWGDGGYVTGEKAHLSARGGKDDVLVGDEQDSSAAARRRSRHPTGPASSERMARE